MTKGFKGLRMYPKTLPPSCRVVVTFTNTCRVEQGDVFCEWKRQGGQGQAVAIKIAVLHQVCIQNFLGAKLSAHRNVDVGQPLHIGGLDRDRLRLMRRLRRTTTLSYWQACYDGGFLASAA